MVQSRTFSKIGKNLGQVLRCIILVMSDVANLPIPEGWEPTYLQPLPCFPCTKIKANGERCKNNGIMGMKPDNAKCAVHGGRLESVKDAAAKRVEIARMEMMDDVPQAIATLRVLTQPGTADAVRLKASTEILDRTIGKAPLDINVEVGVAVDNAAEVKNALERLLRNRIELEEVIEGQVVEVEAVDDEGQVAVER
jgi:hypothetical protein